ncbi:MAG TPA: GNAT family N-acetyltransferase [Thermoplasmata archaeon]|nr:GNAT family N-acetyltransferase [Thermoplasmata archaeon]
MSGGARGTAVLLRPEESADAAAAVVELLGAREYPGDPTWREAVLRSAREAIEARPSRARILVRADGTPLALIVPEPLPDPRLGHRIWVGVARPDVTTSELTAGWDALAAAPDHVERVLRLYLDPPSSDPEPFDRSLTSLGFVRRWRMDLVIDPRAFAPAPPTGSAATPRGLTLDDEAALATLMARAYDDDPAERATQAQSAEPADDARRGTHDLLHGGVGTWCPEASFGVDDGDRLVGATLVQEYQGLLISEIMVDPSARRRGLASRLLAATLRALAARSVPSVRLVVTRENERAYRLYRKLGFVANPGVEGPVWVRPDLVGSLADAAPV